MSHYQRLHSEADKETTEWASFCEAWWSTYGGRAVTTSELFEVAKDRRLLLDLWGGRSALAAAQRFGRGLTSRRDQVFGRFKLTNAGKDAGTNSNAYCLERVTSQTPETRQSTFRTTQAPSGTEGNATGFDPGYEAKPRETRKKPGDNLEPEQAAQDDISKPSERRHRVSEVPNRLDANRNDDLLYLLGTTEGDL